MGPVLMLCKLGNFESGSEDSGGSCIENIDLEGVLWGFVGLGVRLRTPGKTPMGID